VCALALGGAVAAAAPAAGAAGPVNTSSPQLSGGGSTLTTTTGTWLGVTRPFAYAWHRCGDTSEDSCQQVAGQTAPSYTLTAADSGKRVRSQVTASNELGSSSRFSGPTAPIVFSAPLTAPPEGVPRLSPFPKIVIAGRQRGRVTRVTEFMIRGPRRARVSVTCRGRGCPIRRLRTRIGASGRLRLRRAQRLYRAGSVIEIRVTGRGRVGKFTRVTFRAGRLPARVDACLRPGAREPSACPG
jgi:hypothetical protein